VLADLPLLHASPGLLARLVPWLQRRTAGDLTASVMLQGDRVAAPEDWGAAGDRR
jgi:hypothetical protein